MCPRARGQPPKWRFEKTRDAVGISLFCTVVLLCSPFILCWLAVGGFKPCGNMGQSRRPYRDAVYCSTCNNSAMSESRVIKHSKSSHQPVTCTPSTRAHEGKSFIDLPLEIRDLIYALALQRKDSIHLGLVGLHRNAPHHWHPDIAIAGKCAVGERIPPLGLNTAMLSVSKQVHFEGARVLYGRNIFSLSLRPRSSFTEPRDGWWLRRTLRRLRLHDILPISPRYLPFIREFAFRPESVLRYPRKGTDVFVSTMLELLKAVPGSYLGFVRQNASILGAPTQCGSCDWIRSRRGANEDHIPLSSPGIFVVPSNQAEFFAGWSSRQVPSWATGPSETPQILHAPLETLVPLLRPFAKRFQWHHIGVQLSEEVNAAQLSTEAAAILNSGASWIRALGIRAEDLA